VIGVSTPSRRMRPVEQFRRPPGRPVPERRLNADQLAELLERFDPSGERLPLLHDLRPDERVSIGRDGWNVRVRLLRKGRVAVTYSWRPGRIAEQVTVTFSPRHRRGRR
jgi:hypothetical protein